MKGWCRLRTFLGLITQILLNVVGLMYLQTVADVEISLINLIVITVILNLAGQSVYWLREI